MSEPLKGTRLLARRANEVRRYRILRKLIPLTMACIVVLVSLIYVVSVMYSKFGSFTVSVNKYHELQYGLSLSEYGDFRKPTSNLQCHAAEDITNIDGSTLADLNLGSVDGADSGENYLCYTFYCKNTGTETISYDHAINIINMTQDIDEAVRIRLIFSRNGKDAVTTDYARAAGVDENNNSVPEPDTVPFLNKFTVMSETVHDFAPGEISKYTVIIWLEGNDPQCLDNIIGGEFKMDMKFQVVGVSDLETLPGEETEETGEDNTEVASR